MTLQTGAILGQAGYLWSDSAYFDGATGADFVGFGAKVFHSTAWPFAFSTSCVGGNPYRLAMALDAAAPKHLGSLLWWCREELRHFCRAGEYGQLLVAGWCDQRQAVRMFLLRSEAADEDPAFEPIEVTSFSNGGRDLPAAKVAQRKGFTVDRMLRVIDAQFENPDPGAREGVVVRYGGEVIQTKVTRDGVTQEVVRDWGVPAALEAAIAEA